ncbi:hypothetical protein ACFOEZ_02150 [Tianweitania populi]|uniref:Uncharacterized protein n=1 Tax=Tianweitania populi TaxID=1607949 RepID=A0A8J3DVX2_9HYPH|nr:hypothetical protein [Tianweitania populi]GHD05842.1 hypothetical protein GCM10016234_02490 [Tianweitania populi]
MQALLATMADWPPIAVYALVGALVGLIGFLVAYPFRQAGYKFAQFIPIILVASTVPLMPQLLPPLLIEAKINASLPQKIDDATTLQSASISEKELTYFFTIEGELPADFDVSVIKADNLSTFCSTFRSSFENRFYTKVIYDYQTQAGSKQFTVTPDDCR